MHAPIYSGHGVEPEALLETKPEDWWNDVVEGYNFLQRKAMKKSLLLGFHLEASFVKGRRDIPSESMCSDVCTDYT